MWEILFLRTLQQVTKCGGKVGACYLSIYGTNVSIQGSQFKPVTGDISGRGDVCQCHDLRILQY